MLLENPNKQLDLFIDYLPEKPYCSENLSFLRVLPKEIAKTMRYVQPNTPWELRWMVYDVDRATSSFDWYDSDSPPPNIICMNPENGHSHLLYSLEIPVLQGENNSIKAQRYAAAIDIALTKKLDADEGYSRLITKNPSHEYWNTTVCRKYSYDLDLLSEYLDLGDLADKRRRLPDIASGRNVNLFNDLRRWAYKNIRLEWLNFEFWQYEVNNKAQNLNANFAHPLPTNEVSHVAKSVGKWVWKNMSADGFSDWQKAMNLRSQAVRKQKSYYKWLAIEKALRDNPQASQRELSRLTGIPESTVRLLRKTYTS